jgi:hypothetical protein
MAGRELEAGHLNSGIEAKTIPKRDFHRKYLILNLFRYKTIHHLFRFGTKLGLDIPDRLEENKRRNRISL